MTQLHLFAVLSGLAFGTWPLIFNRSGFSGVAGAAVYTGLVLIYLVPVVLLGGFSVAGARWWLAAIAAAVGSLGLVAFNAMLSRATPATVSRFFALMICTQVSVTAAYSVFMNDGHLTWTKALGFAAVLVAAVCLT